MGSRRFKMYAALFGMETPPGYAGAVPEPAAELPEKRSAPSPPASPAEPQWMEVQGALTWALTHHLCRYMYLNFLVLHILLYISILMYLYSSSYIVVSTYI